MRLIRDGLPYRDVDVAYLGARLESDDYQRFCSHIYEFVSIDPKTRTAVAQYAHSTEWKL